MGTEQKILLTGATGFIGKHLRALLTVNGFEVHATYREDRDHRDNFGHWHGCDLASPSDLSKIFTNLKPDFVLHMASHTRPGRDINDFERQWKDTISTTINVARHLPQSVKLSLFFGSFDEYGNARPPFLEDQAKDCLSVYGWGKIAAFQAATWIARERDLPICWIRPSLAFGPLQGADRMIPSVIRSCLMNQSIPLTEGAQTRDFIYVKDICSRILRILRNPDRASGQTLNLCSGIPRTVKSVALAIQRLAGGGELLFGALPYRSREAMDFYGSEVKYNSLFGKTELMPFEYALEETVESYRKELQSKDGLAPSERKE